MPIEPVRKTSVVHSAISKIKELIDEGYFRFGEKLPPERELAKLLGISLPSLREALRALSILGIAEMIRRGAERLHGPVLEKDGTASSVVEWKCTLSVGMASARNAGFDATRLLTAADEALYEAKRRGRNQVRAA